MGEVVQIHVGQAGVQIANACWELYCLEHGITADGSLTEDSSDQTFRNFFSYKDSCKVVPRTVLIDSEPTVIDQIRTGPYGELYNPALLITGKEDSGSNFARGYYTMGAEMIDMTMDAIRTVAESCCNLRGFLIFRAIGGGTGSGLGNLIADQLRDEYDKVNKIEFVIFPSPSISPLIVEPYNALLATHLGMDSFECSFILDNEALYDICAASLNICYPRYKNINRIIGQIVSTFTTSHRFLSENNVTFSEFQTNLVPYPRIHFPVVSYAPFIAGTGFGYTNFSTEQITAACFDPCSQLVRCNPTDGKYMSCVLLYRGQVTNSYVNYTLTQLKRSKLIRFVDWQPSGFKVGISYEPPFTVPCGGLSNSNKVLLTLSNNTIIHEIWCRLMAKYDRLFSRKAFIHHYIEEGLEEDVLKEAAEDICALIGDYQEADKASSTSNMPSPEQSRGNVRNYTDPPGDREYSRGGFKGDRNVASYDDRQMGPRVPLRNSEEYGVDTSRQRNSSAKRVSTRSPEKYSPDRSRQPDSVKETWLFCGECPQSCRTCPVRLRVPLRNSEQSVDTSRQPDSAKRVSTRSPEKYSPDKSRARAPIKTSEESDVDTSRQPNSAKRVSTRSPEKYSPDKSRARAPIKTSEESDVDTSRQPNSAKRVSTRSPEKYSPDKSRARVPIRNSEDSGVDKSRQPDSGKETCLFCGECHQSCRTCPVRLRDLEPRSRDKMINPKLPSKKPSMSSVIPSSSEPEGEEEFTTTDNTDNKESSCHSTEKELQFWCKDSNGNIISGQTCTCDCHQDDGKSVGLPTDCELCLVSQLIALAECEPPRKGMELPIRGDGSSDDQ